MKLQLVSHPVCPYVHRSLITLLEKNVAHELTYIDLANKPEWFKQLSPRGKIPLLVVDGQVLFESGAINEFLDETYGPRLLSDDAIERARERAWIEVANDVFASHFRLLTAATAADYAAAQTALDGALAALEGALRGPLFGGEKLSLVDVAMAPAFLRFAVTAKLGAPPLLTAFPKLAAWSERLLARPSTTRAVPADFTEQYLMLLRQRGGHLVKTIMKLA
ncbi:MAG TPA: glutathione S-transferase family protein [Polyangia bacterium]|jgi:glutathione S-transferase|nr:glutathione S-transferase family protein [Polyangia bacterium]